MTSFTFSAEQIRSAPPEVRHWIEHEILKALSLKNSAEDDQAKMQQAEASTPCTIEEAAEIFNLISGNFLLTQVFFELARATPLATRTTTTWRAVSLSDMLRHLQMNDGLLLIECLNVINQMFKRVRNDAEASLFVGDEQQHIYVHEQSRHNIRMLREHLVPAHASNPEPPMTNLRDFLEAREPEGENPVQPEYAFGKSPQT